MSIQFQLHCCGTVTYSKRKEAHTLEKYEGCLMQKNKNSAVWSTVWCFTCTSTVHENLTLIGKVYQPCSLQKIQHQTVLQSGHSVLTLFVSRSILLYLWMMITTGRSSHVAPCRARLLLLEVERAWWRIFRACSHFIKASSNSPIPNVGKKVMQVFFLRQKLSQSKKKKEWI